MPDPPSSPPAAGRPDGSLGLAVSRSRGKVAIARANFRVFVGEVEVAATSVSPLHWTELNDSDPGITQAVVVRRAASTDRTFYDWRRAIASGKRDVRTVTIAALDAPGGKPVAIWRLEGAVAVRWSGPSLEAMSDEVAMEELEVRYKSIAWRSRV